MFRPSLRVALYGTTVMLVLWLAFACSVQPAGNGPSVDDDKALLLSPIHIPYFVLNPLVVLRDVRPYSSSGDTKAFVSGLRDKGVQERINDNLGALYDHMKERDVPPYRGVKLQVTDGAKPYHNQIRAEATFNYNNVLSIVVTNDRSYLPSHTYVDSRETRNFDLNTGHEITLKDIFADDVDYQEVLNSLLSQRLQNSPDAGEYGGYFGRELPSLLSPFKGVKEEQVFYLTGAGVSLVIDYRTPEFDTGLWSHITSFSFQELEGVLAVTKRYHGDNSDIFVSRSPAVKKFLTHYDSPHVHESRVERVGNVYALVSCRYPVGVPESVSNFIWEQYETYHKAVAEFRLLDTDEWLVQHKVSATKMGPFTNVAVSSSVTKLTHPITEDELYWRLGMGFIESSEPLDYCFDDEGQLRSLASLFVEGFDYKGAIIESFEKVRVSYRLPALFSLDELWEDLQFSIGASDLAFRTRPVALEDQVASIYFSVPFSELGCHNMTIFR